MSPDLPAWVEGVAPAGWPVERVLVDAVRAWVPVPRGWVPDPGVPGGGGAVCHAEWSGALLGEFLAVDLLLAAEPSVALTEWPSSRLALTGVPFAVDSRILGVEILEMDRVDDASGRLAARVGAQEALALTGLAMVSEPEQTLVRWYELVARSGTDAWDVTLSFASACLPGSPDDLVIRNDHVRAAATFGGLELMASPHD